MNKMMCDKCNHEIKCGIRLDGGEPYQKYYKIQVHGFTGEGALCLDTRYDLCETCYSKFIKFLQAE